jgi:hypothetical protein
MMRVNPSDESAASELRNQHQAIDLFDFLPIVMKRRRYFDWYYVGYIMGSVHWASGSLSENPCRLGAWSKTQSAAYS